MSACLLAACGGSQTDSQTDPGVYDNTSRIGNPAVYERIEASSDCAYLQRQFDIAMDNVDAHEPGDPARDISLSYGRAADTRMGEVGCYG